MRRLMWFTIGFAVACVIGVYLLPGSWLLCFLGLLYGGVAVPCVLHRRENKPWQAGMTALLGCAVGFCWLWLYNISYLNTAREYDGESVISVVEISDYSCDTSYGVAADGSMTLDGKKFRVRVYVSGAQTLSPGDTVEGEFRLRLTTGSEKNEATYHQGKGIFLLAYADEEAQIAISEAIPAKYFASGLRKDILNILDALFPEDILAFARALLIGDTDKLTYEMDTDFKLSGIRHVIAVSGLHVSILFSLIYMVSGRKRVLTAVLGLPALLLFAAAAGFTPSVVRACIMQGLMILALLFKKEYDPPTSLAFAGLTMLAVNPMTVTSVGFQLSVGCSIGIFLFAGKIRSFLLQPKRLGKAVGNSLRAKLARWAAGSVSVSVSTMLVTTPLSAYYFGTVSLVAVLTNLLTLWVISFVFYGIMAACLVSVIWLPLGKAVAWVIAWPIRYVQLAAAVLADIPYAAVYTSDVYIAAWLVFCYLLLIAFFMCGRKRPVLLLGCVIFGLVLSIAVSRTETSLDHYRVTVLDVGQGQCILVQSGDRRYVVDCGGDSPETAANAAAAALLSQGIDRLDGLILTHYDTDHAGGAEALLSRIEADTLYLPDTEDDNGIREKLAAAYEDQIVLINENTELTEKSLKISLFPADPKEEGNESCLCILFQMENCDILITGDRSSAGERALLEQTELPELEILIAGHHGSDTSTGYHLLHATRPKTAVISAGVNNTYGHPAESVLDRLEIFGCRVLRTDRDGTIIFRG